MKKRKNALKSGETLVEVMASIVIFLLVVAMLQGAVSFCTSAQAKSREIRTNTNAIIESLWSNQGILNPGTTTEKLEFHAEGSDIKAFEVDFTRDKLKVPYKDTQGNAEDVEFDLYGFAAPIGGGAP